jgi:hypothetical protein
MSPRDDWMVEILDAMEAKSLASGLADRGDKE